MSGINKKELEEEILKNFIDIIGEEGAEIKEFIEDQSKKLASCLVKIEELTISNQIDKDTARNLLEIEKMAAESVFLTINGLKDIAINISIKKVMTNVLKIVKPIVNTKLGWALL